MAKKIITIDGKDYKQDEKLTREFIEGMEFVSGKVIMDNKTNLGSLTMTLNAKVDIKGVFSFWTALKIRLAGKGGEIIAAQVAKYLDEVWHSPTKMVLK